MTLNVSEIIEVLNAKHPELIPMLRKHQAVVSGSFALYYVMKALDMDPKFTPGDIDIYVPTTSSGQVDHWMSEQIRKETMSSKLPYGITASYSNCVFNRELPHPTDDIPAAHVRAIRGVIPVMLPDETKIDFIHLTPEFPTATKYIEEMFDLDFCKCAFDGEKFIVFNRQAVLEQTAYMAKTRLSYNPTVPILEFGDYAAAVVANDKTHLDPLRQIYRINKYRDRGFTIIVDASFKFEADLEVLPQASFVSKIRDYTDSTATVVKALTLNKGRYVKESYKYEILGRFQTGPVAIEEMFEIQRPGDMRPSVHKCRLTAPLFGTMKPKRLHGIGSRFSSGSLRFTHQTRFIGTTHDDFLNTTDQTYTMLVEVRFYQHALYLVALEIKQLTPPTRVVEFEWVAPWKTRIPLRR